MTRFQQATSTAKILMGFLLFCFVVSGCMPYSLVSPGESVPVGSTFTVETSIAWSKLKQEAVETWTIDGFNLQRLIFFNGIKEGQPLLPLTAGNKKETMPVYRSVMNSLEIREFIEASLARNGAFQIATKDLRPAKLDNLDGFRFEFSYLVDSGLKYDGLVVAAKQDSDLLAIMYTGTALHHYGRHLAEAEKIIASAAVR